MRVKHKLKIQIATVVCAISLCDKNLLNYKFKVNKNPLKSSY